MAAPTAATPPPPPEPEPEPGAAASESEAQPDAAATASAEEPKAPPPTTEPKSPPLPAEPAAPLPEPAPGPPATRPDAPEAKPEPAAGRKKRKLDTMGFHDSAYYKIRTVVGDLRPRFLEVFQTADFQNSDAAQEILKQIKVVMELSKKMRLDLSAAAVEPVKPSGKSSAGAVKDEPTETLSCGEKKEPPQAAQSASLSNSPPENTPPSNPGNVTSSSEAIPEDTKPGSMASEIKDYSQQMEESMKKSYVIGGSPIGWNFVVWPASNLVYYGLTKADFLSRQAAK